ncbi:MAG: hypothetical protein AAF488_16525, partial [Planctomycetota bacterium]
GVYRDTVIISTPGSPKAVQLAWEKLIGPELEHLAWEVGRPGPEWLTVARADRPGAPRSRVGDGQRLRWSLQLGDERARRGSGWRPEGGGFHAVVARDPALAAGGQLALRWDAADGERQLVAAWPADLGRSPWAALLTRSAAGFWRRSAP